MWVWRVVTAFCSLLTVILASGGALAFSSAEPCLEQSDQTFVGEEIAERFGTSPRVPYDNVTADARGMVWQPGEPLAGAGRYAAAFDGTNNCWLGGRITGSDAFARPAPSGIAVGTAYPTSDTEIRQLEISGTLNGVLVGPHADDLQLKDILLSETADTCLIADHRGDLVVDNLFFDRCARVVELPGPSAIGTLTIQNSLIRIDDRPTTRHDGQLFNRGASRSDVQVTFKDNVVVTAETLDQRSLAVVAADCDGNTLIWLGEGGYPGELPTCFEVSTDRDAWQAAKRAWLDRFQTLLSPPETSVAATSCTVPSVPTYISPRRTVGNGSASSCTATALKNALAGGGTITFACGTSPKTIPISSELVVSKNTVIDGGGKITLDGQNKTRIIRNNSQLTLQKITLKRGRRPVTWSGSPNGGGAVNTSYGKRLYVVDSTFTDNQTTDQGFGGAIFQAGNGALTVVRSRFENNAGGGGGGVYSLLSRLHVVNSTFARNRGSSGRHGGGGVMTDGASTSGSSGGEIIVCGTSISDNTAYATGAGAYLYAYSRDKVTVSRSTFTGNAVTANSGGVSMGGGVRIGAAPALVTDSTFRRNTAKSGGALATNSGSKTQVRNSLFECNSSNISGSGVVTSGNTSLGC
jgi:hypothetical protein